MFRKTAYILLLLSISVLYISTAKANAQSDMEEQILFYTNKFRQAKGKPPLVLKDIISKEAKQHSKNMAKGKTRFGHGGFDERVAHVRDKTGFVHAAAENVAFGQLNAKEVVDGWIKSAPHRKNLLGDYNLIGIGTASSKDGTIYYTQVFIKQE